jgi:hypothetical protein
MAGYAFVKTNSPLLNLLNSLAALLQHCKQCWIIMAMLDNNNVFNNGQQHYLTSNCFCMKYIYAAAHTTAVKSKMKRKY